MRPTLSSLVRLVLIEGVSGEGVTPKPSDLVYNLRPRAGVRLFPARVFASSPDGESSKSHESAPAHWRRFNAVYACSWEFSPFYALPRDVARIMVGPDEEAWDEVSLALGTLRRRSLIVPREDVGRIRSHQWSTYGFDKGDFHPVDEGEQEWVSHEDAVPVSEVLSASVESFLSEHGVDLVPVDDLPGLVRDLRARGVSFNAENV